MKSQERKSWLDGLSASKWTGARLSVLLIVVVATMESGVFGAAIGYSLSLLLAVLGVVWALRGPDGLRRLAELYLWLAFIVTIYYLQVVSDALAGWTGIPAIDLLRVIAVLCVLLAAGAADGSTITQVQSIEHANSGSHHSLIQIDADTYVLAYTALNNRGVIKTFMIDK